MSEDAESHYLNNKVVILETENKKLREILTSFVELEDSGLSEQSRIKYQTQRARSLLKLY